MWRQLFGGEIVSGNQSQQPLCYWIEGWKQCSSSNLGSQIGSCPHRVRNPERNNNPSWWDLKTQHCLCGLDLSSVDNLFQSGDVSRETRSESKPDFQSRTYNCSPLLGLSAFLDSKIEFEVWKVAIEEHAGSARCISTTTKLDYTEVAWIFSQIYSQNHPLLESESHGLNQPKWKRNLAYWRIQLKQR